ncbi:Adaptor protein complex AP-3 delta subunit [Microthyrium microscopicum]|uniref:AP-3 complex subunit delta n=1 Tax=Microthyrium microscopicum TaxID=703497 RepID=A0A6A6UKJ7_9PEZI|nr:Adaptor protein complex AP-3 delta subunit [Microthyrium microscopicum]
MFEKSLYDLIRGLRHQKGNEREYIQASIRECRKEIKGQDIGLKATALLKLTYLEMFGYDMSWAAFHVLEVMSSSIYEEKRVGYLAAIQSFRPDTEVLMLAENLLKKDLMSSGQNIIALPLAAIPHVINPSMANSLLSELLPRLTHSNPAIRKKTIVTLYRLALVYPETLRPAWPKIKERLLDENEDSSVTSAIVNVICELGWRRPQDFLPLAPRLFDLLVGSENNWMAIKIIKLFATLTPLEPRLVKKLLPPLTSIIRTTKAMSLLYEAVHGIVEGGILASVEGTPEGDELAKLCLGKLRNMVLIEGDPNLKYVALLTFEKIVTSHPYLVSFHQDVILECIDDFDISIRMRALNLVVGMVNSDNLVIIVDRLLNQLTAAPIQTDKAVGQETKQHQIELYGNDSDEEAESIQQPTPAQEEAPPLPNDYRVQVIKNILQMCAKDTYANLNDFEWYLDVLIKLVKACPMVKNTDATGSDVDRSLDISYDIGSEFQNVAVRVKSMRPEATAAAQTLVLIDNREKLFPSFSNGGQGVLEACGWLVGEYASELTDPEGVLNSFLQSSAQLPANILAVNLQAMVKVISQMCSTSTSWTPQRRTFTTLLMGRVIYFLEPLFNHSALEVQELAVEYLELMRLASEACSAQPVSGDGEFMDAPLLITQAIPALFAGQELNPVAPGAQKKVATPDDLDLETPINAELLTILQEADSDAHELEHDEMENFYYRVPAPIFSSSNNNNLPESTASERLEAGSRPDTLSYQHSEPDALARLKARRADRNKDDPFYIPADEPSASARLHSIIQTSNGDSADIDAIPIMALPLSASSENATPDHVAEQRALDAAAERKRKGALRKKIAIVADETLGDGEEAEQEAKAERRVKRSLLNIDSSGLGALSLEGETHGKLDVEQREEEERALKEVERLRLEMQRASERIQAKEEVLVKRKKKKAKAKATEELVEEAAPAEGDTVVKKKKKKKPKANGDAPLETVGEASEAKPKKKKRRQVDLTAPEGETP